jgi:hypothetical protein
MSQQLAETGQLVAGLRLKQVREETDESDNDTISEASTALKLFRSKVGVHKAYTKEENSRQQHSDLPRQHMAKVFCPKFNGENLVIWKDKCVDYFLLVDLAPQHWVRMAVVHFEGAASQWLQVYIKKVRNPSWVQFVQAVEEKFGKDDYRKALTELLELKQENTVEEYFKDFQELQFQVSMHNEGYDDLFFASQFVNGLKEDIRYTVQSQVPETIDRAVLLAKIQQKIVERGKAKSHK